jgi:hypothetical protein
MPFLSLDDDREATNSQRTDSGRTEDCRPEQNGGRLPFLIEIKFRDRWSMLSCLKRDSDRILL